VLFPIAARVMASSTGSLSSNQGSARARNSTVSNERTSRPGAMTQSRAAATAGNDDKKIGDHFGAKDLKLVRDLVGDMKALRHQVTDLRKGIMSSDEVLKLRQEMARMLKSQSESAELVRAVQNVPTVLQSVQAEQARMVQQQESMGQGFQAMQQLRADVDRMRQSVQNDVQQLQALSQELGGLKGQVQSIGRVQQDVQQMQVKLQGLDQLSRIQQDMQQVHAKLQGVDQLQRSVNAVDKIQNELAPLKSQVQSFSGMKQELSGLKNEVQNVNQMKQEFAGLKNDVQSVNKMKQEFAGLKNDVQSVSKMKQEFAGLKNDVQSVSKIKNEFSQLKNEVQEVAGIKREMKSLDKFKQQSDQLKQEFSSMKNEVSRSAGLKDELGTVKRGSQGIETEVHNLKSQATVVSRDFYALRDLLYSRGVLAPVRDEVEEKVAVGTVELGEDVFSARLLLRLGFLKARQDALDSDTSSDEETSKSILNDEGVCGLQPPEIEEGADGYVSVTTGWLTICMTTLGLQLLIVCVMIKYGFSSQSEGCLPEPLVATEWWMLHGSKALAIGVSGALMGKDLMDTMNYWMCSELLEPHRNLEVAFSGGLRILLTTLIGVANVVIFMGMTSPASIWINMAALAFIGELGGAVLDIAKRGVFGHHISKVMTTLNFSLTFMTEYPWWFSWIHGMTLLSLFVFTSIFATIAMLLPDNVCQARN